MRIDVIVYEDLSMYNGAIVQLMELCENLHKLGNKIVLYTPGHGIYPEKTPFAIKYIPVINLPVLRNISYSVMAFFLIVWRFLRIKPDCVLFSEYYLDPAPAFICRIFRVPMVFFLNGIVSEDLILPRVLRPLMRLINLFQKFNCKSASKILAITDEVKEDVCVRHNVSASFVEVIHDGVDIEKFKPIAVVGDVRSKFGIKDDEPIIGFVGGLFKWHGLDYLIKAAPLILKEIPEVKFLIVGDGGLRKSLIAFASEIGVSKSFVFTGHIPYKNIPIFINLFDICVTFFKGPRKNPGDPVKTYEYLACGKPVMASNVKGYGDFVIKMGAGISVNAFQSAEVAKEVAKLLKNKDLRKEMGNRGLAEVRKNHTWLSRAKQVETVMKSISKRIIIE